MRRVIMVAMACVVLAPAASAQDVARGKELFEQCAACHKLQAVSSEDGPSLIGVVGRTSGAQPDFRYSRAMSRAGLVWDEQHLDAYLADPQNAVVGTRMAFGGLTEKSERLDVIAFLKTLR